MDLLLIEPRFCGPPGYAHGGYLVGRVAGGADRQLRIRLLHPTPLQTPLEIRDGAAGTRELLDRGRVLARGAPGALDLTVPSPPSYLEALEASRGFIGLQHHAFPACFACGTERARGDGLRLFAGPLAGRQLVAAPWTPDLSLAGADGKVRPEFMTAALDCPGYFAARSDGVPMLLGEFTAHVDRCVHIDEPCIVIGWKIAVDGRKYQVGTALFDEDGEPCARALALWIEPRAFPAGQG